MIEVHNLSFAYPGNPPVMDGFTWDVERGDSWAVIGPSGCGKSTLLYLLAGLRRPLQGAVVINGQPVIGSRRETGLILQDYGLLPWATAADNIALGLRLRGVPSAQRRETVSGWLRRLDLTHVAAQYPIELSGGQRQRVAIARTLALNPDLLLMDEPFASLDAITRESLQDLILDLGRTGDITTVIVTHSVEEAVFLGRHILMMGKDPRREARIIANPCSGDPAYRSDPAFAIQCAELRRLLVDDGAVWELASA